MAQPLSRMGQQAEQHKSNNNVMKILIILYSPNCRKLLGMDGGSLAPRDAFSEDPLETGLLRYHIRE